jgi:hypothetical protein
MISALAGLRDVIIDAQSVLVAAALTVGVPRFIPSDFCTDFRHLVPGDNRNFDLRREFHSRLKNAKIATTSIFNGAFAEVLQYNIPLLDHRKRTVGYWGDPDWKIDFTTMDDIAEFTAEAALDTQAPSALRIASFQKSPRELAQIMGEHMDGPYELIRLGSLEELSALNRQQRALHPEGELDLYCSWQQSQYMHSMLSAHNDALDNARYPGLRWTPLQELFRSDQ